MTTRIMQSVLALIFCVGILGNSFAQTRNFTAGKGISFRNVGEIIENQKIIGYYTFSKLDKLDKKNNVYVLGILDANLNEISSQKMTLPKYYTLLEASFNKDNLLFAFYDRDESRIVLRRYDKKAKFLGESSQDLIKNEQTYFLTALKNADITNTRIFGIPHHGFLHISKIKTKKIGYEVDFISSDVKKNRNWTHKSSSVSKEIETATFLHFDPTNKTVLLSVSKKPSKTSKKFEMYIVGLDAATGKRKFSRKMEDSKYKIQVYNGYNNEKTGVSRLVGAYFAKDSKMNDNSLGFCTFSFDATGKIVNKKFVSWAKDVAKYLPVDDKGRMDQMGYMYIHNVIPTADGRTFVIAEAYKKAVSAGGAIMNAASIAVMAAGGGGSFTSNFKMVVSEMIIFEMDNESNLQSAKIFDKGNSNIQLPAGGGYAGTVMLGHFLKAVGAFDYSFTQVFKDHEGFIVGYEDFKKIKGEKNKYVFEAIINMDGEYSTDQIDLVTDKSTLHVFPAKPGYIMLVEISKYNRKTKSHSVSMRLEKVDF